MSLWVKCNACLQPHPAESHAGLLRCATCADRLAYTLPHAGPRVVVL